MNEMDPKTPLALIRGLRPEKLEPLRTRKDHLLDSAETLAAIQRIYDQAQHNAAIKVLRSDLLKNKPKDSWKDVDEAKRLILWAEVIYAAGRISFAQYVFFTSFWVENIFENRFFEGYAEIKLINEAIDNLYDRTEKSKTWTDEDSKEIARLSEQYDVMIETKFIESFREFGLNDIADLRQNSPKRFENLRERGLRAVRYKDNTEDALLDIVSYYEEEAQKAAQAGAYAAAIVALGSGLEGLLVLLCLKSKTEAITIASRLSNTQKPSKKYADDPTRWNFETLIEVCTAAGWLPQIDAEEITISTDKMAHALRNMRNNVHPGRIARETPWKEVDEQEYKDAEAIYITLLSVSIREL